jgi:tellurite resistance protein TehA-like permease
MIGAQHYANGAEASALSPAAAIISSNSKNPDLNLVSPLCGPGSIALWLLLTICLILTWTLPRMKTDQDRVSPLLIFATIIPVLASFHEAWLVYNYPDDRLNLTTWRLVSGSY